MKKYILLIAFMLIDFLGHAQYIYTIAGNGTNIDPGDVALDTAGNIYFISLNRIHKVTASTGFITTVAGNGVQGYSGDNGAATSAAMMPSGLALDVLGNIYVADIYSNRIRKVNVATGIITTVAGNGLKNYSGDGGASTEAGLYPYAVAVDVSGNIYIADSYNNRIRKVNASTGIINTVAGNGTQVYNGDNVLATRASFDPISIQLDDKGNIYIADFFNNRIRKVNASSGIISTVAGNGAFGYGGDDGLATSAMIIPIRITLDGAGNIYIADEFRIRKVTIATGIITTIAGNGKQTVVYSGENGVATSAGFYASGLAIDAANNIYISGPKRILKVNNIETAPTATAQFFCPSQGATVANLVATGKALKWYNVAIGGTALASSEVLGSLTYFVSQTLGGIESARVPVAVVVSIKTPNFTYIPELCSGTLLFPYSTTSINGITGTWSPAWDNTVFTRYTFTPTAGQCAVAIVMPISITPPTKTPTFESLAAVCQGTLISPLPSTSTNGITGTWAPAWNNMTTTNYTFTPTAGQCAKNNVSRIITITSPTKAPIFEQISPVCQGTTLSALPTISKDGISGIWAPELNNRATTTYKFTPTQPHKGNVTILYL